MKRIIIYALITVGTLVALFVIVVLAVTVIADNESERERYSYTVGYTYGILLMIILGGLILFGTFKLTQILFFKKGTTADDQVPDKDGPIDRYLK